MVENVSGTWRNGNKQKQKVVHLIFIGVDKPETHTPRQIVVIELDDIEPV
jgi:hypothetical protein